MRLALLLLILIHIGCGNSEVVVPGNPDLKLTSDDVLAIVAETYIFGYPLIMMDLTKKVSTNAIEPHPTRPRAPINQLAHFRSFPDPTLRAVVKPNVDTYYSIVWLDLSKEPVILKMPATDRYYLMQLLDGYTNVFASIGTRTTGSEASEFVFVGPDWEGTLPEGLKIYKSPTNMAWMLGRIQTNSKSDGEIVVRSIQDSMTVFPLSKRNDKAYIAPKGTYDKTWVNASPSKIIEDLSIEEAIGRISQLMVDNPPSKRDSNIVKKMASIGIEPGKSIQLKFDNFILNQKIKGIPNALRDRFKTRKASPDEKRRANNWTMITSELGSYGTDYKIRAFISCIALGANLPEDAVYPNTTIDMNGDALIGSKSYMIHMDKDQLPPVKAFWSLTAYNEDEFLIENELDRYALGSQKDLLFNEDGSLDILVQAQRPDSAFLQNWLPTVSEGSFSLTFRLYWPEESILKGDWLPPSIVPITE